MTLLQTQANQLLLETNKVEEDSSGSLDIMERKCSNKSEKNISKQHEETKIAENCMEMDNLVQHLFSCNGDASFLRWSSADAIDLSL